MRQFYLWPLLIITTSVSGYTQSDSSTCKRSNNSLFIEYGGNAGYRVFAPGSISVNYDRIFYRKKSICLTGRVGSNIPIQRTAHFIPLMLNCLVGKKKLFLELGGGYEFVFWDRNYEFHSALTSAIGLRFQEYNKGIIAKIALTPTFGIGDIAGFRGTSMFGISFGFTF